MVPDHGEGSRDEVSEAGYEAQIHFVRFRDRVNRRVDHLYSGSHPDLKWYCEQFAERLTQNSFARVGKFDEYATHPCTTQLYDIYRRVVFVFSNPVDFNDGIDESDIDELIGPVLVSGPDDQVNMQLFINGLELRSIFLLALADASQDEGKFKDVPYSERFPDAYRQTTELFNEEAKRRGI